jgi:predicted nucleic acid-binding protein
MKIFLDANILVSVLNKEYPLFTYSARILSLADNKRFTIYTSPVCMAIAFYFAEKKHGSITAKQKMSFLADHIQITDVSGETVKLALADKKVHDFEDGIEYYSAKKSKCTVIITEDISDYYFSEIEVLRSKDFMEKYLS